MRKMKKTQFVFKLWLILYRIECFIWDRYSHSFTRLNGGKDFHEYHQDEYHSSDVPF
jgi:hypothetical protein